MELTLHLLFSTDAKGEAGKVREDWDHEASYHPFKVMPFCPHPAPQMQVPVYISMALTPFPCPLINP